MSGSNTTILWIVLGVIVIALTIWWFVRSAAKRRELESRRLDATTLRAGAADTAPVVQRRADRASVTGAIAADAEAEAAAAAREAEAQAGEKNRVADASERDQRAADAASAERDQLALGADRVDPDLETDEAGHRVVEPAPGTAPAAAAPAAAAGVGAAVFTNEEDEPDLADAENPFGEPSANQMAAPGSSPKSPESPETADREDGEVVADEPGAARGDAPAVVEEQVSVPALDDHDQDGEGHTPADDPGDHRGLTWSTSPGEVGPGDGSVRDDASDADATAAAPTPEAAAEAEAEAPREVSRLDEVLDGGYGVGSAAPVSDGAQPLGHPIKAWRETMTYVAPSGEGYDGAVPDVWFFNEDAARAAGFRDTRAS